MRSKFSSLVILLTPLLIILITGVSLENQTNFYITVGTYSQSYSHLSKSYISNLESNSVIVKSFDSEQECIDAVKLGKIHACVVFSPDLRIEEKYTGFIRFYVDYSHLNLAWIIKDLLFTSAEQESKEISQDLINDLISVVEVTNENIDKEKVQLSSMATSNDKLSSIFSTLYSYISVLHPEYDFSKLKLSDLSDTASSLKIKSTGILSLANNKLSELSSSLDSLKSTVSAMNNSEVESTLVPKIEKIKSDIVSYQQTLMSNKNSIDSETGALESYILNLESAVNELSQILEQVKISQQKSLDYINEGKQESVNLLNYIFTLQRSINEIEKKIDEINILSSRKIAEPFKTEIKSVIPEKQSMTLLFPIILSLMILFVSLVVSSTLIQMEKQSEAHLRNIITPTKTIVISLGVFLTTLFIVLLQFIISVISITPLVDIPNFFLRFLLALLLTLISSSVFILIGVLIGSLSKSEQSSLILTILVALLLIIFSGLIYPLEGFPRGFQMILKMNPLYISNYFYNQIFVKDASINHMFLQIITQICWLVGLLISLILLQDLFDEKFLSVHTTKALHRPKKKILNKKINSDEYAKLTKLLLELNHILSPKNKITKDQVNEAKKLYLQALSIYQKLDKQTKEEFFDELNLIHKKLSAL